MKKKAYAKVNLVLRIINKFKNNYHNLQMINARINLYDIINIEKNNLTNEVNLFFSSNQLDANKDNLIIKVVNKMKERYSINDGFNIYIEKNIPIGAGLGGGSVDAAAAVDIINELYNLEMTLDNKIELTKSFGSDIPYGFFQTPCYVYGVGDYINPLINNTISGKELIVIYPNIRKNTKEIFDNNKIFLNKTINCLNECSILNDDLYINDLEKSFFEIYPNLNELYRYLNQFGKVVLSGAGSTMLLHCKQNLKKNVEIIKNKYPNFFIKIVKIL